jgi:hypothetical protein
VSEWSKEHAWRACVAAKLPWVRIPPSPLVTLAMRTDPRSVELRCCKLCARIPPSPLVAFVIIVIPTRRRAGVDDRADLENRCSP